MELVEQALDALDLRPDGPGLAVGVYSGGQALHTSTRGAATVEFGVPIDAHTRFDIASISKQFTATCLLLLAADGKVRLSDDVRTHLPELRLEVPVTLGQCLRHTGGLPEWYALHAVTGVPLRGLDEDRLLRLLAGIRRTLFEPGSAFSYSNTGYILAAAVIRRAGGLSLAAFARERLLGPLGMDDSVFRDDASLPLPRLAFGYTGEGRRADTEESAVGDGGLVTSVADLAPWFGFLADGRVLGSEVREALLERTVLADGTVLPYAQGICHLDAQGLRGYGHAGGMPGYVSNLVHLPDSGLGVAVLTNHSGLDPVGLSLSLARTLGAPSVPSPASRPVASPAPVRRADLVGHWRDPQTEATLSIEAAPDDAISVTGPGELTLTAGDDGRWHETGVAVGAWLTLEDGRLLLGDDRSIRWPTAFVPCDPPGSGTPPEGVWLNDEFGVLAVLRKGELRVGLTYAAPVAPAPAGAWRAGAFSFRVADSGDLLLDGPGLRGLRFAVQPEDTVAVGIPPGLT
ncbi:serine hydrolase domain-containing protein [Nonomuraea sp. NPDC050310]|uniref:serine hydrolase domain-containing protein n=1 Tax=Nonomuraea sp. NPDC050310 TaxID=3154935 RepID=UPI0033DD31A1